MSDLILVTGAAGFIGSNVARMLAAEGRRVVACDWFGQGGKWLNLRDVALHDIIRPEHLADWLDGLHEPLAAIIHMGAISTTTEADVDLIIQRDFIYVADCCAVIRNMLAAETLSGLYNVGTGEARTFSDLARAVFAAAGHTPVIAYKQMPDSLKGRYQYFTQADTAKLRAAGLAPNFRSLEDGVRDYVLHGLREEFTVPDPPCEQNRSPPD